MMGKQYTGMGFVGFDNHTKKYVSIWFDNFGTSILLFEQLSGSPKNTIVMEAHHNDALQGPVVYRTVEKDIDDDHYTLELFVKNKSGTEFKMMETHYTRKK